MDGAQLDDASNCPFPVNKIVQLVFDSRRVTFDDETTIRHVIALSKTRSGWNAKYSVVPFAVCGTGAALSYFFPQLLPEQVGYLSSAIRFASLVAGGCLLSRGIFQRMMHGALIKQVQHLVDLLQDFSILTRKISKWVQDNEVINRSFIMATSVESPTGGKVLSARACLRLRRAAFLESRFAVFILRASAMDLLREVKQHGAHEATDNDICLIPLEEFGDALSIPEDNVEALYLSTDGFSLPALKSLIGLQDLQASEFLKLLCTCVIHERFFLNTWYLLNRFRKTFTLLLEVFHRLDVEYKFETDEPIKPNFERQHSASKNHFTPPDYVRSLELHLTSALKSVRNLGAEQNAEDELQKVAQQDMMEKLGYHVKCASMLLDHLRRRSIMEDKSVETSHSEISPTKSDFELQDVIKADDQIHLEDEIFEAFIMGDAAGDHRGEPVMSQLNNYQEQKQQSRMILEEIKTLLSVRSADWKEREARARERKGLPQEDDSAVIENTETSVVSEPISPNLEDLSTTSSYFIPENIASMAAAKGFQWKTAQKEEQFGSDESDS